jgi:hypothetical protein
MNEVSKSRREALKVIAVGSAGVAFGAQLSTFAQTTEVKPVSIAKLEKLAKDWDVRFSGRSFATGSSANAQRRKTFKSWTGARGDG